MSDAIDEIAPWTIKSFPTSTRAAIVRAAAAEQLTTGQFIERLWQHWQGAPVSAVPKPASQTAEIIADIDRGFAQARQLADLLGSMGRAGIAPQKGVASLANRLAKAHLQAALGPRKGASAVVALPAPEAA